MEPSRPGPPGPDGVSPYESDLRRGAADLHRGPGAGHGNRPGHLPGDPAGDRRQRAGGEGFVHHRYGGPHLPDPAAGPVLRPGHGGGPPAGPSAAAVADGALPPGQCGGGAGGVRLRGHAEEPPDGGAAAADLYPVRRVRRAGQRRAGGGGDHRYGQPGPRLPGGLHRPEHRPAVHRQAGDFGGVLPLRPAAEAEHLPGPGEQRAGL